MIDWNTVIATILASSSVTAIILAVLGFVAKNIFAQVLTRDIEKYKAKNQIEIEHFKAELQKTAFEHQTRYQSLHTKRANVIAKLYELLAQTELDAISLTAYYQEGGVPLQIERGKKAIESERALYEFFERNKIYFKQESCEKISSYITGLNRALNDFGPVLDELSDKYKIKEKERTQKWVMVLGRLNKELLPIKNEIEQEFREILGL